MTEIERKQEENDALSEAELVHASPKERLDILRRHLGDSYAAVRAAARVLTVMERAGDDISSVPAHMVRMLRRVSADELLPEVMVRLGGRVRHAVAILPIEEQRRLVQPGATVSVLMPDDSIAERPVSSLSPVQVGQVFGPDGVRSVDQQRIAAKRKPTKPEAKIIPNRSQEVKIDHERKGVVIGGKLYPKSTLLRWLSEL